MTTGILISMILALGATDDAVFDTLRPEHPRLIALPQDAVRVKKLLADDTKAAAIYRRVKREADDLLKRPPVERRLERRSSPTMLDVSRQCLDRVYTLATVYRIDGDRRYAERAIRELLAAAEFSDWNPRVFLDTAEMTHAVAIGYDWLFDAMTESQRKQVRQAIIQKGLREGMRAFQDKSSWTKAKHNWNLVCNGGMVIGALAVAEDDPQLAASILRNALASAPIALKEYAPDGAWGEGPGYWNYATHYAVYMMASLDSALGKDFGLSGTPGFSETGQFCLNVTGPTGQTFNFADSSAGMKKTAPLCWLARKFNKPAYAWYQREQVGGASPLDLWWYDPRGTRPADLPKDRWFHHVDVAFLRSAWYDPRAVFVGFKAGDNKVNHGHLELGSFVLDGNGERWVLAPGSDSYALPGYFGSQRWNYYRTSTRGQNTVLIDGKNQYPKGEAPITAFWTTPERSHVVADLTNAYSGQAEHVRRGIAMLERRHVLVQDELDGLRGSEVLWQIHTKATIDLHGNRALLKQGKETLIASILSPPDATFSVESVDLPAPQRPMPGVRKLTIRRTGCQGALWVAVLFTFGSEAEAKLPAVTPLTEWRAGSP